MSVQANITKFLEFLGDAILLVDKNAKIQFANSACLELFDYQWDEFIGQPIDIVVEPEFRTTHSTFVENFVRNSCAPKKMMSRSTLNGIKKFGDKFVARISISTINIDTASYGIATIHDYTIQQKLVDDIQHKSITDSLTMLYNRHYLEAVTASDNRWFSSRQSIGVLYLDLDKFKQLNDQYGHAFGDLILKTITVRMKEYLRSDDLIFRMGGDEFVVFLAIDNNHSPRDTAKTVAQHLHQQISNPIEFEDCKVSVGVSIGVGLYPHDFDDIEITMKLADKAMFHSKKQKQKITCVSELPNILKS